MASIAAVAPWIRPKAKATIMIGRGARCAKRSPPKPPRATTAKITAAATPPRIDTAKFGQERAFLSAKIGFR